MDYDLPPYFPFARVEAHTSMAEVVSSAVLASTPLKKPPSIALGEKSVC